MSNANSEKINVRHALLSLWFTFSLQNRKIKIRFKLLEFFNSKKYQGKSFDLLIPCLFSSILSNSLCFEAATAAASSACLCRVGNFTGDGRKYFLIASFLLCFHKSFIKTFKVYFKKRPIPKFFISSFCMFSL